MGRPEKPVDRTVPERAQLADFLRERRNTAELTYGQIAKATGGRPSAATLERAASGTKVPSLDTVECFIQATTTDKESFGPGAAQDRARNLWIRARRATRAPSYVGQAPDPTLISDTAGFLRALRHQHAWIGYPTPGEMERISGPGVLPRTTTRRIIAGDALPVDPHQAVAFLKACYVINETELERWLAAAIRSLKNDPVRTRSVGGWIEAHRVMALRVKSNAMSEQITELRNRLIPRAA
ncbi:helix-turn-helix domain-containing protein [Streptomyces rochei]|uniref:helix-turn-helix domain-containing protein n=1 Tax=Streptomyces rochei TaxID=1928 RepID=UPI00362535F5